MPITILVVDDQPMARAGATMLLNAESDLEVVGEAVDGEGAIELARSTQPSIVLMDLRMPGMGGVEATRQLVADDESQPDRPIRVLVMSTFDDDDLVYDAFRAGASGYLLKHASPTEMSDAVRRVAGGDTWLDPTLTGRLIDRLQPTATGAQNIAASLTMREQEIYRLIAAGRSNAEIRKLLVLSEATVKTHVSRILLKTGSRDRAAAVALAYRSGFVQPGDSLPD